ncbi:MAG TPA: EAL domain-containing protein [Casimicrobiaceae bacterium]|nr:EAL domain-containing protein [Casimicrobiaceae bacterium]
MPLLGPHREMRQKSAAPPPAARRLARARAAFGASFTGQAIAAVALAHGLLMPLLAGSFIGPIAYACLALALSCAAIAIVGRRITISIAALRAALTRFRTSPDTRRALTTTRGARSTELVSLQRGLDNMYRRVARREQRLKAAYEAAQRESAASRNLAQQLTRSQRIARIGSWEWDRASDNVVCSGEVFRILGANPTQIGSRPYAILRLVHNDDRRAFKRWLVRLACGNLMPGQDARILGQDGELRHVHVLAEPLLSAGGKVTGLAGTIQDATERTRAIQQIHRLAYFDAVTELPNRSRFDAQLAETLEGARRDGTSFAIMYLDLDQFKRINDTLGHAVGDDLLRVIAQRLTRGMRPDDIAGLPQAKTIERDVCRHGGDEFIVLLKGVASEQDAARAATRLLAILAQPITLGTHEVFVSASIGIVLYPRDGEDLDTLLKNADVAMYHAKAQGRSRFYFYQDSMRAASAQRLSLEHDLRKALEGGQFELYYQPQIEVRSGRIVGIEALIRWNHPTLGMLGPAHFIPAAEEAGLIMALWEWVMVAALIQHNAWLAEGLPPVTIGVNLSSGQFGDPALAQRVEEIARVVGVPLDYLELEVTESMLLVDSEAALRTLTALRSMGVKIAIDDFGTGYSSLSYLRRLPLDKLKLDQSFIRDAGQNDGDVAITRAIIAMAQSLNLTVVAEGVETQAQIDLLLKLGCNVVQGFMLGRPLPAAATAKLLRESASHGAAAATGTTDEAWNSIFQTRNTAGGTL